MAKKVFATIDEQISILKGKGLTIDDEDKAREALLRESYFFITGYRPLFTIGDGDKRFVKGATFSELYSFFLFDRSLRNIFFKNILIVETNIKSILSYQLSKQYGIREKDYLKSTNFNRDIMKLRQVNDVVNKMKRQIRVNGNQNTATSHFLSSHGFVPLWVSVKVLSFGIIGEFYNILKIEDQISIAHYYNLDVASLSIYLSILANYRNLCAHEELLYNMRTQREVPDNKNHELLKIAKDEEGNYVKGKNDLFGLIIILKNLLTPNEFHQLVQEINYELSSLTSKVKSISQGKILDSMGFPNNWIEIENI